MTSLRAAAYFHPLLFTLLLPLYLYQHNIKVVFPDELYPVLGVALTSSAVLYLLSLLLCRGNLTRAALLTTYVLIIFAFYPALVEFDDDYKVAYLWSVAWWCIVAVYICLALRHSYYEHLYWCVLGGLLVLFNGGQAVSGGGVNTLPKGIEPISVSAKVKKEDLPHIVYIVPDRYPSKEVLRRHFGFDNRLFLDALKQRGFFVAERSHPNYTKTFQALAAVFNMQYLDFVAQEFGEKESSYRPVYHMLQNHEALKILHSAGYHSLHMGNRWPPTRFNYYADENYYGISNLVGLTNFQQAYVSSHPVGALADLRFNAYAQERCRQVYNQRDRLMEAVKRQQPQFIFWHVLLPHPPFLFDPDGKCHRRVWPENKSWELHVDGFIQQLQFTNRLLMELFDLVMAQSQRKVIFVIQSDEGPYPWHYVRRSNMDWETATPDEIEIKFGNLNAIYFPSRDYHGMEEDITPINNMRRVINEALGSDLPMLPHRMYVFRSERRPYQWRDISEQLQMLYEQAAKEGWRTRSDSNARPPDS